jgi:hypothetical protein
MLEAILTCSCIFNVLIIGLWLKVRRRERHYEDHIVAVRAHPDYCAYCDNYVGKLQYPWSRVVCDNCGYISWCVKGFAVSTQRFIRPKLKAVVAIVQEKSARNFD